MSKVGYFKDTVSGISWLGGLRGISRLLTFIKLAILARLLTPYDFGVFGIAAIVLAFLETVTETGINVFFLQEEGELEDYVDTAWIVSIARGIIISLLIYLLSPYISLFFTNPNTLGILKLTAFVPLIKGFINPSIISYRKNLEFRKEFLLRLSIFIFETLVAVFLAIMLRDASSLVWAMLASAFLEVAASFALFKPTPRMAFDTSKVRKVVKRGKWVTISQFASYAYGEGDDVFVGRILGSEVLGIYQVAYKISTLPLTEIANVFHQVTLPVYVRISGDLKRLKKAYFKIFWGTVLLVTPMAFVFYFFPTEIISILLGTKWLAAADVLRILALFGVVRAITFTSQSLFFALKKQEYTAIVNVTSFLIMAIFAYPLISEFGVVGAAYSAFLGLIFSLPITAFLLVKTFGPSNSSKGSRI